MKQLLQHINSGQTTVTELPDPIAAPGSVVVATAASLVSAGTERYVVDLAKKSLLEKARSRPDHVRRVLQKVRQEGLSSTLTQVRAKLDEPMPLGYSAAGLVLECGWGVQSMKPGDRVAVAAPHASVVTIGRNLCARIPDEVSFEQAAYAGVAAIALQGVRQAKVSLGERVLVLGLGLIGQITVGLLKAQGCRVFGLDLDARKLDLAKLFGADAVAAGLSKQPVMDFAGPSGVDAVIITAATSSNEPIEFAADVCRTRGRIVLVGVAGLNIPRPPFYAKELEFTVSSSLGPGRGDSAYEEKGIDYPIGHARWTAGRNMEAVLETIAAGRLPVDLLTTHRFPIERAPEAYEMITTGREPFVGIVLQYSAPAPVRRRITLASRRSKAGALGVSLIGAGNFGRLVMLPALSKLPVEPRGICTAKGLNAQHTGERYGFDYATTEADEVFADPATDAVFIATRHNLHADLVVRALQAGKHVFVEKPLCIAPEELEAVSLCIDTLKGSCPVLMVGFNRRFAPATLRLQTHFDATAPLSISYRFAPGALKADAWPQDDQIGGGRIIGEACHAIDMCVALAGSEPVRVFAESVMHTGSLDVSDDRVVITMRHRNGSISTVFYQAGGDAAGPRERIEIFGGGRTGTLEGWQRLELWNRNKVRNEDGGKDKGHHRGLQEFVSACREGARWPIPWLELYGTTWASLAAVQSLRHGMPVHLAESGASTTA